MLFVVFFLAGVIVALTLAYKGLVGGSLQFSKTRTLTGRQARTAGLFCLGVALLLLGAAGWAIWTIATRR